MAQVAKDKPKRYKLTLSKLDFVSLVDDPAQPNATTLLIKSKDGISVVAKYLDASDELGLAWFWAFTSTEKSGEPHYDHHGDQVAADTEMVKAVLDYMKRGGSVDEMHDYEATEGRCVFAMPVTADVAKAIGIAQTGLLVTIKCTAEQIAKLKDGTYTGVSIAGMGTREVVEACKSISARVVKGQLVTSEQDGHQHTIEVLDDGSLWCSYNTATGAEYTHNHAVIRSAEGAIEILADSGHSHELAADQPAVVIVAPDAIVVVADGAVAMRRSPPPTTNAAAHAKHARESTRSEVGANVEAPSKGTTMTTKANETDAKTTDLEKQVVSLTKRAERAESIAKLSGVHKAHFDALPIDAQDAFLSKGQIERNQAVETLEKSDPVEFELDGIAYRKSMGPTFSLAKQLRDARIEKEQIDVEKAATAMLGGTSAPEIVVAKAIRSIANKDDREAAEKLLKGLVSTSRIGKSAPGSDGANGGDVNNSASPLETLTKGLVEFCKAEKIDERTMWTTGLPKFEQTEKGRDLKASYDESRAG